MHHMHLNEAFFQSELNKMFDDSWVIVGNLETMESQCDHVVGGDCEGRVGEEMEENNSKHSRTFSYFYIFLSKQKSAVWEN